MCPHRRIRALDSPTHGPYHHLTRPGSLLRRRCPHRRQCRRHPPYGQPPDPGQQPPAYGAPQPGTEQPHTAGRSPATDSPRPGTADTPHPRTATPVGKARWVCLDRLHHSEHHRRHFPARFRPRFCIWCSCQLLALAWGSVQRLPGRVDRPVGRQEDGRHPVVRDRDGQYHRRRARRSAATSCTSSTGCRASSATCGRCGTQEADVRRQDRGICRHQRLGADGITQLL